MTADEIFQVIREAIGTVMEIDPATVTRATSFADDLKADSLALVEVVEIVEERLAPLAHGFHIDDDDLDRLRTVGQAVDYAVARL